MGDVPLDQSFLTRTVAAMDMHALTQTLKIANDSKIVMLVADGLGGLPREPGGPTEL